MGSTCLMTLRRGRADANGKHDDVFDYRHVIHSLRRNPMALWGLVYRDSLFPRDAYRQTFNHFLDHSGERAACRTMDELLSISHERYCEAELRAMLEQGIAANRLPDLDTVRARFALTRNRFHKL